MSSAFFRVTEHTVPGQHIRQYPNATINSQEEVVQLAVKQYTPLNNPNPQPGDVTVIAAHANGFPKELYEPLFDDLLQRASSGSFRIRNIWIADVAHQGLSSVLNEDILGNDPSWLDHSRDLLHIINHFRYDMHRPLVGMGHSMGACQIAGLALLHPRLFETIILLDPVIHNFAKTSPNARMVPAHLSAIRRDRWPSRQVAETSFKKSKFYQQWDPRVLNLWIKWGLRDLPTKTYPNSQLEGEPEVTLTTTKAQEVFSFLRPVSLDAYGGNETALTESENDELWKMTHADVLPFWKETSKFYRFEPTYIFNNLQFLRPKVLWIFGEHSPVNPPPAREAVLEVIGTNVGGSGGVKSGAVKEVLIPKAGHLIAMENVDQVADAAAKWIGEVMTQYKRTDDLWNKYWEGVDEREKFTLEGKRMRLFGQKEVWGDVKKGKPKL